MVILRGNLQGKIRTQKYTVEDFDVQIDEIKLKQDELNEETQLSVDV
jgi:hypothetical protein